MLSRIPWNFALFGLMGLVLVIEGLLAQTWVGTIIAAVLLMPLWSVAIINGVFLVIAIEVLARKLSKFWLLVPGAWFAGNAAYAWQDHVALSDLRREIAAINAGAHLPFDPGRDSLVLGDGITPNDILGRFEVPQVYVRSKDPINEPPYMVYRLVDGGFCNSNAEGAARTAASWTNGGYVRNPVLGDNGGYCVIGMAAPAPDRAVLISKFPEPRTPAEAIPAEIVRIQFQRPDGTGTQARNGTAKPLPWLPLPFVGCFSDNIYKPNMTCYHRMDRWSEKLTGSTDLDLIGRVLSLPLGPSGQSVKDSAEMWKIVAEAGSYRHEWQIRRLDAFLANPDEPAPLKVSLLEKDPAALAPRIPRILAVAARMTGEDSNRHEKACDAYALALSLDAAALKPFRQQIRGLAAADDCYGNQYDIVTGENLRPDPEAEAEAEEARQEAAEEARMAAQGSKPAPQRLPAPQGPPPPYRGPLASPSAKSIVPEHP